MGAHRIIIRRARATDDAFVVTLGAVAFAVYSRDPREVMRRMLDERRLEVGVAEVAVDDGGCALKPPFDDVHAARRVGFVAVDVAPLGRPFGPLERPKVARVDAIAVTPDARGRGVGTKLLAWAEANARARGACVMSLNTATQNAPARRLFSSYGFATLADVGRIYAGGRAAIAMSKALL